MIADTSEGGAIRVVCNGCAALSQPARTRSWRVARDAAQSELMPPLTAGWAVGRGLSTDDTCPRCAITPATRRLVECSCD